MKARDALRMEIDLTCVKKSVAEGLYMQKANSGWKSME